MRNVVMDVITFPENLQTTIGITHVFSYINICRVPRMLFEHEADRPSVQHHPRDPANFNAMKKNMCDRYSCIFYLIPAQFALKTLFKH